jgi:hypothetical protein
LHRHLARPGRIDGSQGADGIETVEQEVRVDLRAQHAQLRFLRHQLRFQARCSAVLARTNSSSR